MNLMKKCKSTRTGFQPVFLLFHAVSDNTQFQNTIQKILILLTQKNACRARKYLRFSTKESKKLYNKKLVRSENTNMEDKYTFSGIASY